MKRTLAENNCIEGSQEALQSRWKILRVLHIQEANRQLSTTAGAGAGAGCHGYVVLMRP